MTKKIKIPALALAAALTATIPAVSMARDRDDHHEAVRGRDDRDFRWDRGHDRGGWNVGLGVYADPVPVPVATPVPAPAPTGYYDQYGVWHPYAYGNGYYGY